MKYGAMECFDLNYEKNDLATIRNATWLSLLHNEWNITFHFEFFACLREFFLETVLWMSIALAFKDVWSPFDVVQIWERLL